MKTKVDSLVIEGVEYVPKDSVSKLVDKRDGMDYVMIRTYSAGVHCGWLKEKIGKEVTLLDAIRIWEWSGAASLSQLSQEGTNDASNCKFGVPMQEVTLTEAIEIIKMTETAKVSIQNVGSWKI
jgi:hypothetical protein